MKLKDLTTSRANNFQLLRLLAATSVFVFHCYALTDKWFEEPLFRLVHDLNLGALGVQVFFVISGFLVTKSWVERRHFWSFTWARVLRIYPALAAATLVTVALAAWSSALPLYEFLTSSATARYVWRTALALGSVDRLPLAFAHNPFPHAVNGSLWTLPIEVRLYAAIAIAGIAGLIMRTGWWTLTVLSLAGLTWFAPREITGRFLDPSVQQISMFFAAGSLAFVWSTRIAVSVLVAGILAVSIAVNPLGGLRGFFLPFALTYVVLIAAYHPLLQWQKFNLVGDYSYGIYIYSFPVQQTVVAAMPSIAPPLLFAFAFPIALGLSALSWHWLERPALRLKMHPSPRYSP
ncbi:MAG: acyltransferase [Casimicrobiaceae bacterium]